MTSSTPTLPITALPVPTRMTWDIGFREAATRGELVAQRCRDCGRVQLYARPACQDCLSENRDWMPLSGRGTVYSFTIIRQTTNPAFAEEVPFVLLDVELEEGQRIVSRLVPGTPDVVIGDAVTVTFVAIGDSGEALPYFVRATEP